MEDKQITCKHCGALNFALSFAKAPNNGKAAAPVACRCQEPVRPNTLPEGVFTGATLEW